MNKRHGIIAVALVALLLATSCSTFFTGGVSGKVKCNGEPVARATVALYFDEGQRNADFDAQNKVFHTDYKTETQENGSFAITNIPWDDAFPEYGKDADSKTAYAIIYHKDYGYKKIDGITVISGRSNEFFPEFDDELTKTETVTIQFMNPETKNMESGVRSIDISYEGRPGYDNAYEATVPVNAGIATFDIVYQGKTVPKFNITDIAYATYAGTKPYAGIVDKELGADTEGNMLYSLNTTRKIDDLEVDANNLVNISTIPLVYDFGGFRGAVEPGTKGPVIVKVFNANADGSDIHEDQKDKPIGTVFTRKTTDRDTEFTIFDGLGRNIKLFNDAAPTAADPEVKGYKAVITGKYIITVADGSTKNKATASSDPDAVNTYSVTK